MFISELFYKYEVDGTQLEGNDKEWLPYFITFLEGINDKNKNIYSYIEEIKHLIETSSKQ